MDTTGLLGVSAIVLFGYLLQCKSKSKSRSFLNQFPGPPEYPLVGSSLEFLDPGEVLNKVSTYPELYGQRVKLILGPIKFLTLYHPDDIQKVLTSTVLTTKSSLYDLISSIAGAGLPLISGKKWQLHRKLLTPAFHFQILENFQNIFNEHASILVEILQEKVASGQDPIEMQSLLSRCGLDIICETAMGTKLNGQRDLDQPYAAAYVRESHYISHRLKCPWLYPKLLFNLSQTGRQEKANRELLFDFADRVIQDRKILLEQWDLEYEAGDNTSDVFPKRKLVFLDLLLNAKKKFGTDLSDDDIREEVNTFIFVGHESSSTALIWMLYLIGTHPEEQENVHRELDLVLNDDRSRPINAKDLADLKYLECCIKETLRLYPIVPVIARKVLQEFQLDENTIVPPGVDIFIMPYNTHRNPEFFPEPEKFIPSRHFPNNAARRHPYAYIPFSGGPRNCLGQKFAMAETKIVLAHILRNFKVTAITPVTPLLELVIRPKNGIRFHFEAR